MLDRIFSLSKKARLALLIMSLFLLIFIAAIIVFSLKNGVSDKVLSSLITMLAALFPTVVLLTLILFREQKENIGLIEKNINILIERTVPNMIKNRFFGEPFDPDLSDETKLLKCETFYKPGSLHAGYRVTYEELKFEFTVILTLYRITIFFYMPNIKYNEKLINSVNDVAENLINCGFQVYFEHFGDMNDDCENAKHWSVVYLRRELDGRFADIIISPREQFMLAREITEWVRTVMRKLKYDPKRFKVMEVPLHAPSSFIPFLPNKNNR